MHFRYQTKLPLVSRDYSFIPSPNTWLTTASCQNIMLGMFTRTSSPKLLWEEEFSSIEFMMKRRLVRLLRGHKFRDEIHTQLHLIPYPLFLPLQHSYLESNLHQEQPICYWASFFILDILHELIYYFFAETYESLKKWTWHVHSNFNERIVQEGRQHMHRQFWCKV